MTTEWKDEYIAGLRFIQEHSSTARDALKVIEHLQYKLKIAEYALDEIEDQCNDPFDVNIAEEALKEIRA